MKKLKRTEVEGLLPASFELGPEWSPDIMDGPDGYMSFVREPRIGTSHERNPKCGYSKPGYCK
jgi:hypothetical protein